MGKKKQLKGTKLSVEEFVGTAVQAELPTAPREREEGDEGELRRGSGYRDRGELRARPSYEEREMRGYGERFDDRSDFAEERGRRSHGEGGYERSFERRGYIDRGEYEGESEGFGEDFQRGSMAQEPRNYERPRGYGGYESERRFDDRQRRGGYGFDRERDRPPRSYEREGLGERSLSPEVRPEAAAVEEPPKPRKERPAFNPFGEAKPREEILKEKGIDPEKLEQEAIAKSMQELKVDEVAAVPPEKSPERETPPPPRVDPDTFRRGEGLKGLEEEPYRRSSFGRERERDRFPSDRHERGYGDRGPRDRRYGDRGFGGERGYEERGYDRGYGDRGPRRSYGYGGDRDRGYGGDRDRGYDRGYGDRGYGGDRDRGNDRDRGYDRGYGDRGYGGDRDRGYDRGYGGRGYGSRGYGGRSYGGDRDRSYDRGYGDRGNDRERSYNRERSYDREGSFDRERSFRGNRDYGRGAPEDEYMRGDSGNRDFGRAEEKPTEHPASEEPQRLSE